MAFVSSGAAVCSPFVALLAADWAGESGLLLHLLQSKGLSHSFLAVA